MRPLVCTLFLGWLAGSALGAPVVIRAASVAPDGSAWAREMHAMTRNLESRTDGRVKLKWYLNAVAGGDVEMGQRVRRGQLDFVASGGMLCTDVMPSMGVLRSPALFQSWDEAKYVMNKLNTRLTAEARERGFVYLGGTPLGSDMFFLRRPVQTIAELRALKLWEWDLDTVALKMSRAMGLSVVPLDLAAGARAFDDGKIDGFFAIPTAALVFQWSTRAQSVLDYKGSFLFGCFLLADRAYYSLSSEDQKIFLTVLAQANERNAEIGPQTEKALLGGAFQHQGAHLIHVSESFRAQLFSAANAARDQEGPTVVPKELLENVKAMLLDYRAEHATASH